MKVIGKVTCVDFTSFRYCEDCGATVKKRGLLWWCPNCGQMDWKKTRRRYEISLGLDVFDTQLTCIARNHVMDQFLAPVGLSLRELADELAHFRGEAWTIKFRDIKKEVDHRLWQKYGEQIAKLNMKPLNDKVCVVARVSSVESGGGTAFIEGSQRELLQITRSVLSNYEEKLELWSNIPIIRYTKNIQGELVEIGVRAPVVEYGKAYRVWIRVNDVHMFPTTPIYVGGPHHHPAYVYRIYHTKGWKEKLKEILRYCISLEDLALKVVGAGKKLQVEQMEDILQELSPETREKILELWHGGSVWDLVKKASEVDREAGLYVLKKFGLLMETRRFSTD